MSNSLQHAFEAEEVMAYLDGALEPERAAALAAHLDACGECRALANSFRQLTDRMLTFEVEPAPQSLNVIALEALDKPVASSVVAARQPFWKRVEFWNWPYLQRVPQNWAIGSAIGAAAVVLLLIWAAIPNLLRVQRPVGMSVDYAKAQDPGPALTLGHPDASPTPAPRAAAGSRGGAPQFESGAREYQELLRHNEQADLAENLDRATADKYSVSVSESGDDEGTLAAPDAKGPMIEQNVSLHIVPTSYDQASAAIEKMAAAHGGYVATLSASAQTGSARDISVELRIPVRQADAFIEDLRKLGKVVEETRSSDEVTAEYVDLQARLKAAKAAEQRLVELLGTRTGKLSDVLEVERELTRVRSEIESMQGQANVMLHQVNYATVKVELSEEYHETLHTDSVGNKIRNAFVNGLKNLEDGIIGALVFVLDDGISIAFWGGLLIAGALVVRKRIRSRRLKLAASSPSK